jgi:uncharacterized protein
MPGEIRLRFYEELNDYLPPERRKREFKFSLEMSASVGQVLENLGVPETEVELALVNGASVGLSRNLKPGDRVSLYPVFESFDVKPVLRIRNKPLRQTRFLVEPQMRRLAFYLRMLGFDAPVDSRTRNAEEDRRIVLTADSELLKSGLPRVYVVRERKPGRQLKEVLSRFDLFPCSLSFFRVLCVL